MGPCQEWGWHLIKGPSPEGRPWRSPARGPEYAQGRFSLQDEPVGPGFPYQALGHSACRRGPRRLVLGLRPVEEK